MPAKDSARGDAAMRGDANRAVMQWKQIGHAVWVLGLLQLLLLFFAWILLDNFGKKYLKKYSIFLS